ncbi:hypothetical protein [Burkholderia cenocepacia]|uniref:hypothetical protein n=1 Tax=Burkholderia cenocepacia TaxID=95486 RepID=UPI002AB181F6|nr:hypothetical protein [Burkholderia cenocepacia]
MMLRRYMSFGLAVVLMLTHINAHADGDYVRMQRAVGGIVQQLAKNRGLSVLEPQLYETLSVMGRAAAVGAAGVGAGALAAGTSPAWGTVLLVAAVSTAVGYAVQLGIDGVVKWAFGDPKGATPITVTGPDTQTEAEHFAQVLAPGERSTIVGDKGGVFNLSDCYGPDSTSVIMCVRGVPGLNHGEHWGAAFTTQEGGYTLGCLQIVNDGEAWNGHTGVCARYIKVLPRCPVGSAGDLEGKHCTRYVNDIHTSPKTLSDAIAAMPREELVKPLTPEAMAILIDGMWRKAAQEPGYSGLPYSYANPVTPSDVRTWQQAHPDAAPTVGDLLAPVPQPSIGLTPTIGGRVMPVTPANPGTKPDTTPDTKPDTKGATRPDTKGDTTVNLGPNPGIAAPGLEATPTAASILQPLLTLLPDFRHYVTPAHMATCPKPVFQVFGKTITMEAHCTIAERVRSPLHAVMTIVWLIAAMFIILSA